MRPNWYWPSKAVIPATGVVMAIYAFSQISAPPSELKAPAIAPPKAAFSSASKIAAIGIIEPASELIDIGAPTTGVVRSVAVVPGQWVAPGDLLFKLDDRRAIAESEAAKASASSARANIRVAETARADAAARLLLYKGLQDKESVSRDESDRATFALRRAEMELSEARARAEEAASRAKATSAAAEELVIRAPIKAEVLAVNVRAGERAEALNDPLMVLGDTSVLHVRVEIAEEDIARLDITRPAQASFRSNHQATFPLRFIRFEPLTQAKRNLAGGAERIDTRVVQAIYAFNPGADRSRAFIGMRMDVFLPGLLSGPDAFRTKVDQK